MGTIKVPAAVVYAHKIANYAHDIAMPSEALAYNLHYLWVREWKQKVSRLGFWKTRR